MRYPVPFAVVAACVLANAAPAADKENKLPAAVAEILEKAEAVELLSLDPGMKGKEQPKDGFHGYKVLGKTAIKNLDKTEEKSAVVDWINEGIKESDGSVAACFNPRHGIKATHDGKTVELVICFECLSMQVFDADGKQSSVLTSGSPQKTFDKLLVTARVPLPEPKK